MIKFKLFGILWDFRPILGAVWCFIALILMGLSFYIDQLGWWNVLYALVALLYLATAESISKLLTGENDD